MEPSRGSRAALAGVVAALLLLAGCTSAGGVEPTSETDQPAGDSNQEVVAAAAGELMFGLRRCEANGARQSADPAFYRDEPIYVGNEMPIETVRQWAVGQPGYEDIWIDREHNGWVSVGFSENAADRQQELEAEFPGVGVVAVDVVAGQDELQSLRSEVEAALDGLGSWTSGHSVARGLVEIGVPVLDEPTLERFADLASPLLCVEGKDPGDAIPDGPQLTEGDGWRLLGSDRTGSVYRTAIATSDAQYEQLWAAAGLTSERPAVDFDGEVAIWFGAVYGSGCEVRMDDVIVDEQAALIHALFVMPGNPAVCNGDANAEAYVVAVPRERLPAAPFRIQLDAEDPPGGHPEERTTVNVDLRAPGSFAAAQDLVVDQLGDGPAPLRLYEADDAFEPGYPDSRRFDLSCTYEILGPINSVMWQAVTENLTESPPPAWVLADDLVEAGFFLQDDPPLLTVTINGHEEQYEPIPASESPTTNCGT